MLNEATRALLREQRRAWVFSRAVCLGRLDFRLVRLIDRAINYLDWSLTE